jgi:hypothetical protein
MVMLKEKVTAARACGPTRPRNSASATLNPRKENVPQATGTVRLKSLFPTAPSVIALRAPKGAKVFASFFKKKCFLSSLLFECIVRA